MKHLLLATAVALIASSCALVRPMKKPPEPWTSASGLIVVDLVLPEGRVAQLGDKVLVHYELRLKGDEVIDSSRNRGIPLGFTIGEGEVIPGFDEAVTGMAPGGIRQVIMPPELGYGEAGVPGTIPAAAELTFDIELMDVTPPTAD